MAGLPEPIQRMMLEMQVESQQRLRRRILEDPARFKATLEFPEGARMSSQYWGDIKTPGRLVRYCYSTERNLAGYFLTWRTVLNLKTQTGKRDQIVASKRRATVREKALARTNAHKARLAGRRG